MPGIHVLMVNHPISCVALARRSNHTRLATSETRILSPACGPRALRAFPGDLAAAHCASPSTAYVCLATSRAVRISNDTVSAGVLVDA